MEDIVPRPPALHHVALGAQNVELVARFYEDLFGLARVAEHRTDAGAIRSIWLGLGGGVLMIEHSTRARERHPGVDAGPFLLAFHVDASGREKFESMLAERAIVLEDRSEFSSYARDPENNRIAVSCYPLEPQ